MSTDLCHFIKKLPYFFHKFFIFGANSVKRKSIGNGCFRCFVSLGGVQGLVHFFVYDCRMHGECRPFALCIGFAYKVNFVSRVQLERKRLQAVKVANRSLLRHIEPITAIGIGAALCRPNHGAVDEDSKIAVSRSVTCAERREKGIDMQSCCAGIFGIVANGSIGV